MRSSKMVVCSALSLALAIVLPGAGLEQLHCSKLTVEQMESFLKAAKVTKSKVLAQGITNSRRATLSDGKAGHDAHIQTIDERKSVFQTTMGSELNFVDSWKNNMAAYILDRMLDLYMVPVTVERKHEGKTGSFTWWVDDKLMDEKDRFHKKQQPPDAARWNAQMYIVRVFDELIYNADRNLGNIVITTGWDLYMIDHTRAFRLQKELKEPKNLVKIDPKVLEALRNLKAEEVKARMGTYLNAMQIEGMMARRDKIVKFFDDKIAAQGKDAALCDAFTGRAPYCARAPQPSGP